MRDRKSSDLFDALPGDLRVRDAEVGHPLEALMALLTNELEIVEQDIDQLYDNWFVESCEPWVLPYIAALVAARPMRDIGAGGIGQRAYLANILTHRQTKGTAAAIEQVVREVTGWPTVAVEFFEKLAMSQHLNHLRLGAPAIADIRDGAAAKRTHSPFEQGLHSPAAGPVSGYSGRYNISHLGLFIWRRSARPLEPITNGESGYLGGPIAAQSAVGAGLHHFDPLGRDLPLVNIPTADTTIEQRVTPRHLPIALERDTLREDLDLLRAKGRDESQWFGELPVLRIRLGDREIPPEKLYCCNLELSDDGSWHRPHNRGEVLFDPLLGRISLHAQDQSLQVETAFSHAGMFDIGGGPYNRADSIEQWRKSFFIEGEATPWRIGVSRRAEEQTDNPLQGGPVVANLRQAIARWNSIARPGMRGIITIMDSATYEGNLTAARKIRIPAEARLAIVAADWPLEEQSSGASSRAETGISPIYRRPHIKGNIMIEGVVAGSSDGGQLVIDGLLVEGVVTVKANGTLRRLDIRHSTIGAQGDKISKGLRVLSGNEQLTCSLSASIAGFIRLGDAAGALKVSDSIIGEDLSAADGPMPEVVTAPGSDATISSSTIFGQGHLRSIASENSLFTGPIRAARRQQGCMRFCYVAKGSETPSRYLCVPDIELADEKQRLGRDLTTKERALIYNRNVPVFSDRIFARTGFGQLRRSCPETIAMGAEEGMEMGVGYSLRHPARFANLNDAMTDYLPFGLNAAPIIMS